MTRQGRLSCFICCMLHVVVDHLTLHIIPFVANGGTIVHITFLLTGQNITYCIDTISMCSLQVLMRLLHHKIHFCNLGVKFLQQCVNPTSVAHTDKLIDSISQVFFQHGKRQVVVGTT
jgi:hypothetical protein